MSLFEDATYLHSYLTSLVNRS